MWISLSSSRMVKICVYLLPHSYNVKGWLLCNVLEDDRYMVAYRTGVQFFISKTGTLLSKTNTLTFFFPLPPPTPCRFSSFILMAMGKKKVTLRLSEEISRHSGVNWDTWHPSLFHLCFSSPCILRSPLISFTLWVSLKGLSSHTSKRLSQYVSYSAPASFSHILGHWNLFCSTSLTLMIMSNQ